MQTINLIRFSKQLRASGQFTPEQADALAEALADALTVLEPPPKEDEDWVPPKQVSTHNKTTAALFALF